ncbi:MAG: DegV family protein [Anaerolineae bacterium]
MSNIAIVTDSNAYFEPGEAERLNITVVPLHIHIGDEVLKDGEEMNPDAFFQRLQRGGPMPTVSAPSVEAFQAAYTELHKSTDKILSIHVSGCLSPTVHNAQLSADTLLGRCTIEVIDSMTISVGLGILAKTAAEAARDGAKMDDIVRLVRGMIPHIYVVLYVDRMGFLERSGRISRSQAILGSMLNIKPILFMEDGEIIPLEKVRTPDKAIEKLFNFVAEFDGSEQMAIIQATPYPTEETKMLLERLGQLFPDMDFPIIQYNPVLATHVGPTALGVIVYEGMDY